MFSFGCWMSNGYWTNTWRLSSGVRKIKKDFWCWSRKYKIFNYGHSNYLWSIASNSLLAAQSTIVGIMQSFLMNALFFWFYASLIQWYLTNPSLFCVFNVFSVFLGRMKNLLIRRNILKSLASQSVWNHYLNTRYFVEFWNWRLHLWSFE